MKRCPYCAQDVQDTATVCEHCGRDLTPAASTTPPMGATPPDPPAGAVRLTPSLLSPIRRNVIIVAAAGLFVLLGALARRHEAPVSENAVALAVAWNNNGVLQVKNLGTPDIAGKNITIYLNGTPPFAYKLVWPAPAVGETVSVPLDQFVYRERRFDPRTQAVSGGWIGGPGHDYAAFGR